MTKQRNLSRLLGPGTVLLSALGISCATGAQTGAPTDFARQMDTFVQKTISMGLAPGVAVAVIRDGKTVYINGHGFADREQQRPVTPETVFYIASSTKSFTGLAASLLHLKKTIDLDAPVSRYVPDIRLHGDLAAERISLRDLLTHTHGISNNGPVTFRVAFSGQHTPELLFELLPIHGPAKDGRAFRYGNVGYNVASMIMDQALGRSWKDVLKDEIFVPLEMRSTTGYISQVDRSKLAMPYGPGPDGFARGPYTKGDENMHAAGGLVTTASDLARWVTANLQEGRLDGRQVLPEAAFEVAHHPHATQDARFGPFRRTGYGLGWNTGTYGDEEFWHHFGGFSGFHAHVGFMPRRGLGVVVLVNSAAFGSMAATATAEYAYGLLLEKGDPQTMANELLEQAGARADQLKERFMADQDRRSKRPQKLPHPLDAYAGVFDNHALGRVEIRVADGKLAAQMGLLKGDIEVYDGERNALRVAFPGGARVIFYEFAEGQTKADGFTLLGQKFKKLGD